MKTFTLRLEFTDGNFDFTTIKADNENNAVAKVIKQNKARLNSPMFKETTKEIKLAEVQ